MVAHGSQELLTTERHPRNQASTCRLDARKARSGGPFVLRTAHHWQRFIREPFAPALPEAAIRGRERETIRTPGHPRMEPQSHGNVTSVPAGCVWGVVAQPVPELCAAYRCRGSILDWRTAQRRRKFRCAALTVEARQRCLRRRLSAAQSMMWPRWEGRLGAARGIEPEVASVGFASPERKNGAPTDERGSLHFRSAHGVNRAHTVEKSEDRSCRRSSILDSATDAVVSRFRCRV